MFKIIAHRGASNIAPENTLVAFKKAIELSTDFIEIDVHLSKDGIPIVIHDAFPERTTNFKKNIRVTEMSLEEIKELDAGTWFSPDFAHEKIPTLQEVLLLAKGSTGLMIEIKKGHTSSKLVAKAVADEIKNSPENGEIIVGSFSPSIIEELQEYSPHLNTIGIAEDFNMVSTIRSMKLKRIALWYKLLTPHLVEALHEEGTTVWAFTVNDAKTANFLISIGVDGLITNDCQLMKTIRP